MRLAPSVTSLILAAGLVACGAQSPASNSSESQTSTAELVADIDAEKEAETERLNAWFETKFNEAVSRSPMSATFLGAARIMTNGMMSVRKHATQRWKSCEQTSLKCATRSIRRN